MAPMLINGPRQRKRPSRPVVAPSGLEVRPIVNPPSTQGLTPKEPPLTNCYDCSIILLHL